VPAATEKATWSLVIYICLEKSMRTAARGLHRNDVRRSGVIWRLWAQDGELSVREKDQAQDDFQCEPDYRNCKAQICHGNETMLCGKKADVAPENCTSKNKGPKYRCEPGQVDTQPSPAVGTGHSERRRGAKAVPNR